MIIVCFVINYREERVLKEQRNSFKGSIGFVLAAAGSAVGLGNIWRFPYLAAKDGGGVFLLFYLILALTFGFTLLTVEIAIGRKTKQSPLTAYSKIKKGMEALRNHCLFGSSNYFTILYYDRWLGAKIFSGIFDRKRGSSGAGNLFY